MALVSMGRVFIHCGYPKAGSTALQRYLWGNRDDLRKQGIVYPAAGIPKFPWPEFGHHNISLSFSKNSQFSRFQPDRGGFKEVLKEWQGFGGETLVLSSENFLEGLINYPDQFVETISEIFHGSKIYFVFIVRDLSGFFASSILQQRSEWRLGFHPDTLPTIVQEVASIGSFSWYTKPLENARRICGDAVVTLPHTKGAISQFLDLISADQTCLLAPAGFGDVNQRMTAKQATLLLNLSTRHDITPVRERLRDMGELFSFEPASDFQSYNLLSKSDAEEVLEATSVMTQAYPEIPTLHRALFSTDLPMLSGALFEGFERRRIASAIGIDVLARPDHEYLSIEARSENRIQGSDGD